ncbi:MAG: hypothetical protein DCE90_02170 [Pseudanabaena sp.]|nr:MAG: hypothetical protein DCE90_02170 [Pseudanabaena sp.]
MLKYLSVFLLFTSLGYLGNYFRLPLFFGIDFIFGSIFSLAATYLYGLRMGVAVSAIASIHTFFLWQQPYAAVLLILESLWVGVGVNRQKSASMIWLVLFYWLFLGAPLCFLIYTTILKFGLGSALLVVLKQAINGIFNALIVHLLIDFLPLQHWLSRISSLKTVNRDRSKVQQILFNLLLAFVLLPILIFASLTGYQSMQYVQNEISTELSSNSIGISQKVKEWHNQQILILRKLSAIAAENDFSGDLTRLQFATESLGQVSPFLRLYIKDAQANLIFTFPQITDNEEISSNEIEAKIFEQAKATLSIVFSDIHTSRLSYLPHIDIVVPIFKNNQFSGIVGGSLDPAQFKNLLTKTTDIHDVDAVIFGRSQRVIASTLKRVKMGETWNLQENGMTRAFRENQIQWLPKIASSIMTRWRKSLYIQETAIGSGIPWTLIVKLSPVKFINSLVSLYTYILLAVLVTALTAALVARFFSRRFVKPLSKLVRLTTDLQANIHRSSDFEWQHSHLEEIDTLGDNFQAMAIALRDKFQEIQNANLNLGKRIEERSAELLKSELRLEKITNAIPGAVYQFKRDRKGNYSVPFMNQGAYDIYEISREDIYRDISVIINLTVPEDREKLINSVEESAKALTPWVIEYRLKTPSGKIKWLFGRSQPILQEDGSIVWNGIISDITRFKQTEKALQKSEERWHLAVQASESGIWDWNIEKDKTFRSERWWEMMGLDAKNDYEQEFDWSGLLHPDDREYHLQQQSDYLNQKIPRYFVESRMRYQDGSYRWILTRGVAVWDQHNKAIRLIGTTSDVTDLKIARAEMTQAMEEAQAANHAKSEFLAMMSHEIRTPMNAVIGMASLLLDTNLDAEQQEFTEIIKSSGDNLLTIINSILDFSKIESGRFSLDICDFNLRTCVEECFDVIASSAISKNIELAYCINLDVPEWIESDPSRLRQILINLLSNAVKFTHRGSVTLQIELVPVRSGDSDHISEPSDQCKLRFKVKDTGIGIPRDRYDRLFKPFSQVDSSTTREYGGTGLGLVITKRLTELMGGNIEVESEVGVGSCFTFTITVGLLNQEPPYKDSNESSGVLDNYYRTQLTGRKLLILEDNQVSRDGLSTLGKNLKMQVWETSSMTQAIAWMQEGQKFDLAIIDAYIPIIENRETDDQPKQTSWIRQQFPLLPILFVSCCHRSDTDLLNDRLTSYISRPAKRSQIYGKLAKLIDNLDIAERPTSKNITEFDSSFAIKFPLVIMLAEDNIVNQKVAVRFLNRLGYYVDIAQNGCEVIDLMSQKNYDIILMDIHMPVMDGIVTTQKILNDFNPHPWIVALTANASSGDRDSYLNLGMNDYVSKPIQIREITRILENAYHALKSPPY